jgi:glycosyltransferase involved in cell wall biosynthesis
MKSSTVSFVIPAYNAAQTIERSLKSLQRQSVTSWRAIVVDDGSNDATATIVDSNSSLDTRVTLVRQPNRGVSAARNAGLSEADGHWVVFMDADDWIEPDYLERMWSAAADEKCVDVVRCGFRRLSASGAEFYRSRPDHADQKTFFQDLARTCVGAVHCYMTRTNLVRSLGGFEESLRTCEDWDLWQRVARSGARLATVPEHLAVYQMRKGSLSTIGPQLMADARVVINRGHIRRSYLRRSCGSLPHASGGVPPNGSDDGEPRQRGLAGPCCRVDEVGEGARRRRKAALIFDAGLRSFPCG